MSATNPITQRDVAEACGLHPSTVCLALKNSPSIPIETRRRIQGVAEQLGYHPNVAARNLALLRNDKKSAGTLPIAWINQEAHQDHWRADPDGREYFDAARRRAEEAGYHLEEIWTREPGMNAARIVQIVRARGIEGVIFAAQHSFDFSLLNAGWSDVAIVGLNDHRFGEWVDVVCADYFKNTELALRRLRDQGIERVGLVLSPQFDAATNGLVHSCYLRHQAYIRPDDRVPVCFAADHGDLGSAVVMDWLRDHRPDAVLGRDAAPVALARVLGLQTDWIQLHGERPEFDAGVDAAAGEVADAAIDCLVEKIRRFDKGIREFTQFHLIRGSWQGRRLARREPEIVVA